MTLKVQFNRRFESRTHTSFKNYILTKHLFNFNSGQWKPMHDQSSVAKLEEAETDSDESNLPIPIVHLSKQQPPGDDDQAVATLASSAHSCLSSSMPSTSYQPSEGSVRRRTMECLYCDKVFSHRGDLNKHLRIHSGEKPYACPHPQCEKRFAHSSNLRRHTLVHSGDKPFCCDQCGKCFNRKDKMLLHQQTRLCRKRSFISQHSRTSHDQ